MKTLGLAAKIQSFGSGACTLDCSFAKRIRRLRSGGWPKRPVNAARTLARELSGMIDEGEYPLSTKAELR